MAQGVISGGKLSRHWDEVRRAQPVAGLGLLVTGGPRGQFWHRRTFRVGLPVPEGELTAEQLAGYAAVNTYRDTLGTGRHGTVSPAPAAQVRPKSWPTGKAMVLTRATRRALQDAAERAEVRGVDGVRATGGPVGAVMTRSGGMAGAGAAFGRRAALAPRGSRVDGAAALRRTRAALLGGGSGLTRRTRAGGTEVGLAQLVALPQVKVAIVTEEGASLGVGAMLQAGGSVEADTASGTVRAIPWWATAAGDQGVGWRVSYNVNGEVRLASIAVWLKHEQTGQPEEVVAVTLDAAALGSVDLSDPDTWPTLATVEAVGDEETFERWTVLSVGWV